MRLFLLLLFLTPLNAEVNFVQRRDTSGTTLNNVTESGSNVGISSTTPGVTLDVGGSFRANKVGIYTSSINDLNLFQLASGTFFVNGSGEPFRIVGINKASNNPNLLRATVDIAGNLLVNAAFQPGDATANTALLGYNDSFTSLELVSIGGNDTTPGNIRFMRSASDASPLLTSMFINSTGWVSIGNFVPVSTLTVAGAFNSTGTVTLGDDVTDNFNVNAGSITFRAGASTIAVNGPLSIVGSGCASGFKRVGLNCCEDSDGDFEAILSSTPDAVDTQTGWATVNSTTLNGTNARSATFQNFCAQTQDGSADNGATALFLVPTGQTQTRNQNTRGCRAYATVTNTAVSEDSNTRSIVLDVNKDFDFSCSASIVNTTPTCAMNLVSYCE